MKNKMYFAFSLAFAILLTTSLFLVSLSSVTTSSYNIEKSVTRELSFSPRGVIDDITTTGSYNFTIHKPGYYKFRVDITGDLAVGVKLYFEQKVFSHYFDRYMSSYQQIDSALHISPDVPYEVALWIGHPGDGFFYITKESGTAGSFTASVTPIKTVSDASTLPQGDTDMNIPKDSAYIGNFSVSDHSRVYNLTVEQRIPALPLTTIIKRAWVQINLVENVNASHPVNITFIEDGLYEHSIGQITQNVSVFDQPLKFYFSVSYLNFTENSINANQIKFNTTDPDIVSLYDSQVMIEEADGDITELHSFPFLVVFISNGAPYTTYFNLYDTEISLDVGVTASVMDPNGFLGYDSIASLSLVVPTRKVREWMLDGYNTTPAHVNFILEPRNYTFLFTGSKVADSDITVYLNERSYSILSINDTLDITFNKSESLGFGSWTLVLLNITSVSPDKLYQIQASMTGNNWSFGSLVFLQGVYIGEGAGITRIDKPGYSYHETTTMKDIHLLPVTMYSASYTPMDKLHITYFGEKNQNGTYASGIVKYRANEYSPSRNTLLLLVIGQAQNTVAVNSSETATLTLSFDQSGTIETVALNSLTEYTMNGNTTGYKILKLKTQPGYEYNLTIAPSNTQGQASFEMFANEYKENVLGSILPFGTTPLGKSISFEYSESGLTSFDKYILIKPFYNDTKVQIYVSETAPQEFPASGTAELKMGAGTNNSHVATLKFKASSDEAYSIKITTKPGYVGVVSIFYVSADGMFPFKYTPDYLSILSIPGGNTEVVYEYIGKISGDGFMIVYASGIGTVYITITRRYLVPDFIPIPGLFLVAALPIALVIGLLIGWIAKRGRSNKTVSRIPSKKKTKSQKKK